ncbi:hypothetical protein BT96DRAFT_815274 [Gymnopus androsaceus JB14]|uniref:AB hydrolase-1 domain-containing protein n=1 Tax=Gymnopus androsaceus JB14 TaxID=1447944 RepID=A0A6A4HYC2_9AGAR|nr:hypothetical protein BT96DRAFT_815274 [Gymnopus androsaceus JB14]
MQSSSESEPTLSLLSESYTFDSWPYHPLVSTAKRYWNPSMSQDGLTLVFFHGGSFHKEHWEPVIDDLLVLLAQSQNGLKANIKIREMWSIDAPTSGDSALLNEEALRWGYESFQWQEYGRSIHAFLTGRGRTHAGFDLQGPVVPNIDFSSHILVGIGHSIGAVSLVLSLDYFPSMEGLFSSGILVEPMIMNEKAARSAAAVFTANSVARRDIWPSREEAYKMLKARHTWKIWDDRTLRIYVNHGLRPLPTLEYPNIKDGLTLKCTRKLETASYRDLNGCHVAYRNLRSYVSRIRLHLVYSTVNDGIPAEAKQDIIHNATGGLQNLASVEYIEGAAHLSPQTHPRAVAEKIFRALRVDAETRGLQAKL